MGRSAVIPLGLICCVLLVLVQGQRPMGQRPMGGERPMGGGPNGGRPMGGGPNGGRPMGGGPNGGRPMGGGANGGRPMGGRPNDGRPMGGRPNGSRPMGGPNGERPFGGRPNGGRPMGGGPMGVRLSCTFHSEVYQPAEKWSPDSETDCHCRNGTVVCSFRGEVPSCVGAGSTEGEPGTETGIYPSNCVEEDGTTRYHGDSWQDVDQCATCSCADGTISCTCDPMESEEPQSDLACVEENGTTRLHGDTWELTENCASCSCDNATISCFSVGCEDQAVTMSQGGESLNCVSESGTIRLHGETWIEDECADCSCDNGNLACQTVGCEPLVVGESTAGVCEDQYLTDTTTIHSPGFPDEAYPPNTTTIHSPGFPDEAYPPNTTCIWELDNMQGMCWLLQANYVDFEDSTDCELGGLLYEDLVYKTVSARLCGTQVISYPTLSGKGIFTFHSDDVERSRRGFNTTIYSVPCPDYGFVPGEFGECQGECGEGMAERTVDCIDLQTDTVVDESLCSGHKPVSSEPCDTGVECPPCPVYEQDVSLASDLEDKVCSSEYILVVKMRDDNKVKVLDDLGKDINPHSSKKPILDVMMASDQCDNTFLVPDERYVILVSSPEADFEGKSLTMDDTVLVLPSSGHTKDEIRYLGDQCA